MKSEAPATVRQIYALAAVLCERAGEAFPQTRGDASAMLDRLKGKPPEGGAVRPRDDVRRGASAR